MKTSLLSIALFFSITSFAQLRECPESTSVEDYYDVEAEFPGGPAEFQRFFFDNFEYPTDILDFDDAFYSRLYVSFIVLEDGSLCSVKIEREAHLSLEKSGIDLINKMPKWIPAKIDGRPVASKCIIPININLE